MANYDLVLEQLREIEADLLQKLENTRSIIDMVENGLMSSAPKSSAKPVAKAAAVQAPVTKRKYTKRTDAEKAALKTKVKGKPGRKPKTAVVVEAAPKAVAAVSAPVKSSSANSELEEIKRQIAERNNKLSKGVSVKSLSGGKRGRPKAENANQIPANAVEAVHASITNQLLFALSNAKTWVSVDDIIGFLQSNGIKVQKNTANTVLYNITKSKQVTKKLEGRLNLYRLTSLL